VENDSPSFEALGVASVIVIVWWFGFCRAVLTSWTLVVPELQGEGLLFENDDHMIRYRQ
jgi:hypothetical protein